MFLKQSDLPLDRDSHSRFLPWLVAFMVFLAVTGLSGIFVLNEVVKRWGYGVSGTVTIQIPAAAETADDEIRLDKVLKILTKINEIESYEVISVEQVIELLAPWLGGAKDMKDLPLPQLIDVKFKSQEMDRTDKLSKYLSNLVPGVRVDDHQIWLKKLVSLVQTIKLLGFSVLALIMLATVGTVIFTTNTGLAIHREAIEVLHLIGARDTYIAKQFAFRAFALGFKGGVYGLIIGIPPVAGIGYLGKTMEDFLLPSVDLVMMQWGIIFSLPIFVGIIAMLTARMTVTRSLARLT